MNADTKRHVAVFHAVDETGTVLVWSQPVPASASADELSDAAVEAGATALGVFSDPTLAEMFRAGAADAAFLHVSRAAATL